MFPENRFMEVLIIGAVALIIIGPKDLPLLMRRIGQFVGKMRGMANEFRASFDELARQSELDELRKEVEALRTSASVTGDPHGTGVFNEIKDNLSPSAAPVMTPLPQSELVAAQPEPAPAPEVVPAAPKPARKPRAQAAKTGAKPAAAKPATRKPSSRATGPAS